MKISRPVLLLVLMLTSIQAHAEGSLFVHATKGAVHLRWNAPLEETYDGFYVERQPASGGDWTRLNESAVTRMTDVDQIRDLLGPLADNGGPTKTHALLEGSPAIDAGDDEIAPDTDQRGVNRPRGSSSDIGAFEY